MLLFLSAVLIVAQGVYHLLLRKKSAQMDEEVWNACLLKGV